MKASSQHSQEKKRENGTFSPSLLPPFLQNEITVVNGGQILCSDAEREEGEMVAARERQVDFSFFFSLKKKLFYPCLLK